MIYSDMFSKQRCEPTTASTDTYRTSKAVESFESLLTMLPEAKFPSLVAVQDLMVEEALSRCDGNQARAARMLGVTRQAINKRLRKS